MKLWANACLKVVIVCVIFLFATATFSFAASENIAILEKSSTEYVLYFENLLNSEGFEYAFSNDELTTDENLNYIASTVDTDGNTVAYIDTDLYELYFENKEATYIWVKNANEYIEQGTKLEVNKETGSLLNSVTDEQVDFVKQTTQRIETSTEGKESEVTEKDGIRYTVTVGTVEILNNSENKNYLYSLIEMPSTEEYNEFFELAESIYNSTETNVFENLVNTKTFYNMYKNLISNVTWNEVQNNKILQPEDSQNGEKYIVWLKCENDEEIQVANESENINEISDVKFLTSYRETDQEFIKEEIIIKETHKLPITYDSIVLFVILGVAVLLFIIVLIMKKKSSKNQKEN